MHKLSYLLAVAAISGFAISAGPVSASPLTIQLTGPNASVPEVSDGLVQKVHGSHRGRHRHRGAYQDNDYSYGYPAMAMAMAMAMDIRAMTSPRLSASGSLTLTIITSAVTTGITAEDITGGITVAK